MYRPKSCNKKCHSVLDTGESSSLVLTIITILLASLMVFSFGCVKKDEKEIKIGAILPLTGDAALYGEIAKSAIELAKEEINAEGGINGKPMSIVYEDSQVKPELAVNSANKLINVDNVQVIVGAMASSEVMALAPIMNDKKVILISPSSTSHEITNAGDYIFRTIVSDIFDGTAMARFVSQKGYRNAAVFYVSEAGPEGVAKAFIGEFQKSGGTVALTEVCQRGERDFRSQIIKLKNKTVDIVYFALYPVETEFFVRQYRELKADKPLFTHQLIDDPEVLKKLGAATDGIIFSSPKLTPDVGGPEVKSFYEKYKQKYKKAPQNFASNSYDAIKLIAYTMNHFGTSSDEIKKGLYSIKDYKGASGTLTIDQNGDVDQQMLIMIIRNDQPTLYQD